MEQNMPNEKAFEKASTKGQENGKAFATEETVTVATETVAPELPAMKL